MHQKKITRNDSEPQKLLKIIEPLLGVIGGVRITPLTAGAAYIRVYIFLLNIFKIKCDVNQQNLKRVDLHFVKSE